ncbi:MAG: pitrilysin family protein [Candidatus Zixiibacteriota bacterium]
MKTIYSTLLAVGLLSLFAGCPIGAQNVEGLKYPPLNQLTVPEVQKVTLDNGMQLYLLQDKSLPVFNVSARINCGEYLEPADKVGLANICGMVMRTGGTAKWTGDQIDEMLEGIGGRVETGIDVTSAGASINVLSEYTDLALEVLAEILRRPVFNEDKIDLAKMQHRTGIARRNDEISTVARREFLKLIYGADSPYARHTEYATINTITRDDLVAFHDRYFKPENVQLAVWGDIDADTMIEQIKKYFGDWQRGSEPVPPPPAVNYEYRSKVFYAEKTDVEQAYIRIGHIGGLATDPDYADRIVMSSILGEGFGSRLTDAVRTKLGLAYSTGGRYISNFGYPGYFFAMAATKPQSALQATREMLTQIKSMLTDPPTEPEMKKGKDGYLNSFVFNFDSRREVLDRMMTYDFYGLPEDFLQQEKMKVESVTPEAVQAAAKTNIRPDEMIVLVVGNAAQFDEPLENLGLGPVDTIDITIPSGEVKKEVLKNDENLDKGTALLMKAIETAGGLANFKKVQSTSINATITVSSPQGEIALQYETANVYPQQSRSVIYMMGQPFYDIRNGTEGWKTGETGEVVPMTEEDIADNRKEQKRDFIYIFSQADHPYYEAVYDGPDISIDDVYIEYVAISDEDGDQLCRLGIGKDGQLVCKAYYGPTPFGPGLVEETYYEWTEVDGIKVPMKLKRTFNGQDFGSTVVSEFLVNPQLNSDLFARPTP